jgi:OmpA-OmpF porin, OOP family
MNKIILTLTLLAIYTIAYGQEQQVVINVAGDIRVVGEPERLGATLNSPYNEFGPTISPDGNTLYFSRRYHPENVGGIDDKEDIWYSEWDAHNKQWKEAKNIGTPLNNDSYNFISSVTPDGNTLLVGNIYGKRGEMNSGASISRRTTTGWTFPEKLDITNEKNKSDQVNYSLSSSGKVLIISAERPKDTKGKRDLYVSFLQDDGKWTEPKNLGEVVNTKTDDYAPFLAADERTLYYSTSGYPGFGKDDIFITRRLGDGWDQWTEPENLGPKINTAKDDAYFTLPASGEWAYYCSNAHSGKDLDIYRIILPLAYRPKPVVLVKGRVLHQKSNAPLPAKIVYYDLKTGKELGRASSNPTDGQFQVILPSGINYGYMAEANNFVPISANLDLQQLKDYKEIKNDLMLVPLEVGEIVRINNVFFDFDKATLQPESITELSQIINLLNKYPEMAIELSGHTDNKGSAEYNEKLSMARANTIMSYLTAHGINQHRLMAKGYGKSTPVTTNDTDEGRAINRRVEFKILKK